MIYILLNNVINNLASMGRVEPREKFEVESTMHFFLQCLCFSNICKILFNELISVCKFIDLQDSSKLELLLYGSPVLSFTQNSSMINASINYIIKSERFKGNLFGTYFNPKLHLILSRN